MLNKTIDEIIQMRQLIRSLIVNKSTMLHFAQKLVFRLKEFGIFLSNIVCLADVFFRSSDRPCITYKKRMIRNRYAFPDAERARDGIGKILTNWTKTKTAVSSKKRKQPFNHDYLMIWINGFKLLRILY